MAALTVGLTSACGASSEESQEVAEPPAISSVPPSSGLGAERMDPDPKHAVPFPDLGLILAGPSESEARFSDGVGMFGTKCLLTANHNLGTETYQVSLVLNDDTDSLGVVQDAASMKDVGQLLAPHQKRCA